MPKLLGSINCYVTTAARIEEIGKAFTYDSTTLDMVKKAIKNGAKAGYHVHSETGCYIIYEAKHDHRVPGFWATRVWP